MRGLFRRVPVYPHHIFRRPDQRALRRAAEIPGLFRRAERAVPAGVPQK